MRTLPAMFDDRLAPLCFPSGDRLPRQPLDLRPAWRSGQPGRPRIAGSRRRKGVQVGLCLPNTPYSVIFYYAALKAGGTVVNFNPLYVERELKQQIADSGTTVMVVPDLAMICRKVDAVAAETGLRKVIICPMAAILPPAKAALFTLLKRKERARFVPDALHVPYMQVIARREPPSPYRSRRRRTSRSCNIPAAPPARRRARCCPMPT